MKRIKPQNITEEQGRAIKEASERVNQLIRQESGWTDCINGYENRIKDIKMGRLMTIKAENIVINLLIFYYRQIYCIGV